MYQVTSGFLSALSASHNIVTRCEVLDAGNVVQTLEVLDGSVSVDGESAIRRRASVSLTDKDGTITPAQATDLLAPFGNEIKLYRGVALSGGDELIPLGVFGIEDVEVGDGDSGLDIKIDAYDRARKVERARFTSPYTVASGTNYATAIKDLIANRVPGLTYSFEATARTTPALMFDAGADPWEAARDMASSIGYEVFFDADGVCVLRSVPDPETSPVLASYVEGATATILSLSKSLTRERTYNHVIVSGENTDATVPVRAEAKDTDPSSPTYWQGDYGDVPYFFSSEFITTAAQAQDVADALLRKVLGLTELVRFDAIVNPAHDVGDVIQITRTKSRVNAQYVLESFGVPLKAGGKMQTTTRKRKA